MSPNNSSTSHYFNFAACSDRGLVRANNEDSAYAGPRLLVLADGMGGHAAGEVASQFLVNAVNALDTPLIEEDQSERLVSLLAAAADEGNQAIATHVAENPHLEGMGTTLSTVLLRGNEVGLCHVGDSRGYLLRDGTLQQITKDDTFVQSLVDQGRLDPEDVSSHPQRSLILKALTGMPVEPTLETIAVQPGDRFMLCSDGLSDPVSFETIETTLSTGTPDQAARRLVELAIRSGGPDNVTVVIGDVVAVDAATGTLADPEVQLPASPILAGAIAGAAGDSARPDTSATRAAALNLLTHNAPAGAAAGNAGGAGAAAGSASTAGKKAGRKAGKKAGRFTLRKSGTTSETSADASAATAHTGGKIRKRTVFALLIVASVLLAAGAGLLMVYKKAQSTYFVAEAAGNIQIFNGVRGTVLGQSFHKVYQEVCLTEQDEVVLFTPGEQPKGTNNQPCHLFATDDLTPVARGAISTLPEGTYDEVRLQVQRLADRVLPVCVQRQSTTNAPEDLTTPGVSCREVQ